MIRVLLGVALIAFGCSLGFWTVGVDPNLLLLISFALGSIGGLLIALGFIDIKDGY
ncbi:hypothetical protein SCMU_14270 [Sinomonas cyclohexanicum]|uniref:Uncharacterized protein n=1 Tax=Sinomonas cyclohexanicum TaxID=322009 RepID=A0ABM7PTM3_SINCY|nr:hypothetical protein [Corynebacterium cyclohexanicum]BCT75585.1 hypothetical protein SCMU_14270 [Corynebacterium cyclohexanicum]